MNKITISDDNKSEFSQIKKKRNDIDIFLMNLLTPKQFDDLNQQIIQNVTKTYKRIITPNCDDLLKNDRILGRILNEDVEEHSNNENWYKDPINLTSFEIFQETSKLRNKIQNLKIFNEQSQKDLELLKSAQSLLDLEIGYKLTELIMEEEL